MYAPLPSALKPARVLFLSRGEGSVRMDVKALRGLGVTHCVHESETAKAILLLQEELSRRNKESGPKTPLRNPVDLVICDEQLADGPASALLFTLSKRPDLATQPVLVIASSSASAAALRAAGVYVIQRPYKPRELARMMQKAMSPMRRRLAESAFARAAEGKRLSIGPRAAAARAKAAAAPMTTSDWYRQGLDALKNGNAGPAEHAFLQVLERQEDHVGAALGLARICRGRDDVKAMRGWLVRAAAASLRLGDRQRAAAIAAMLPETMRHNIFAHEAAAHMEQGAYRPAALSFLDAGKDRPEIPIHTQIARVCVLTPKPEESMTRLCGAFDGLGHTATASFLRRRLLDYAPYDAARKPSWLDKYPLLKEAVSVAAYTAWAWKSL